MTTTVPTHGGPAVPVSSDTSGKTMGRVALRAYGFPSEADAIAAGFHSEAGPASSVYVVSAAELVSGKYVLEGDPKATPIYAAPAGMRVEGGYSQPVYLVGGSLSNAAPVVPPAIAPLVSDIFTGADGTNINAHTIAPTNTPGTAWTNYTNYFTIQSNSVAPHSNSAFNVSMCNPGIADGVFALSVNAAHVVNHGALAIRGTDKDNFVMLSRTSFSSKQSLVFYTNVAGAFTAIGNVNCDWVDGSELAIIANGTALTGYVNAIPMLSATSSFNQTATLSGPVGVFTDQRLDNFFVSTVAGMPKGALKNYVFCGDSLTSGTLGGVQLPYPNQCILDLHAHPIQSARGTNLGIGGQRAATIEATEGANANTAFDAAYAKNICVVWVGTNDIQDNTATNTILTYITNFCNARKAAGFKVAVCNIIKRGDFSGAQETARGALNTALASGYVAFADAFVDVAANAAFSNPSDTTYYQSDTIHLTTAGATVVAGLVATAIAGL